MSDSWAFRVTADVSGVNHGYHIVWVRGAPRIAKKAEVTAWQLEVAYRTKEARPSGWTPGRRVRVSYAVWFRRAGRDADGIVKFLVDGIAAGLGINDRIVLATAVSVETDKEDPRVEVTISDE
jgi:Holliday junction resolvase RusA-like endonuclease